MRYEIHAVGPQANPSGTVFKAEGAALAYTRYLATLKLFGDAAAFDENGAISETELRQRALADGWRQVV